MLTRPADAAELSPVEVVSLRAPRLPNFTAPAASRAVGTQPEQYEKQPIGEKRHDQRKPHSAEVAEGNSVGAGTNPTSQPAPGAVKLTPWERRLELGDSEPPVELEHELCGGCHELVVCCLCGGPS